MQSMRRANHHNIYRLVASVLDGAWTQLQSSLDERYASPNLKVILGVVGGMALAAMVVFVSVPCVRWYKRKRDSSTRTTTGDIESSGSRRSRWGFSGSRRSSARQNRHHHHGEKTGCPDGLMQPLLPELSEVSTFTWSNLRHSKNSSAESLDELDVADVYSLPTNDATLSHRTTGHSDRSAAPSDHPYSVLGGQHGSAKRRRSTAQLPPSAKRSLSPPGLPPKTTSHNLLDQSPYNRLEEQVSSPTGFVTSPTPTVSLPSSGFGATKGFANTLSDKALSSPGIDMQPISEGGHVSSKPGSGSRPVSLQYPSPPASPHHVQSQLPPLSRSRSTAQSHSRSNSQQLADWRFANAQRPRPPLSSALSAPTALPFRPPPATGSASATGTWWASSASRRPGPSSAAPLTSAFQAPLARSDSQSSGPSELYRNPSTLTKSPSPIPEASVYHATSRVRSPSVVSERSARTPQGARPRPVDTLRQESSTSARSSRRASLPVSPLPPSSYVSTPAMEETGHHQLYLRSNTSLHTPQVERTPHTPEGQSVAPSYFDRRPHMPQSSSSFSNNMSHVGQDSPTTIPTSPRPTDYAYKSPSLEPGRSRRTSISSAIVPGPSSSRSRQPAFVRREDSQALRPMPATALLHSQSPPRGSHSRSGSLNYAMPSVRGRSGSVVSSSREGSDQDRIGRNSSARAVLPPLERIPPMEFGSFDGSAEYRRGED
ncbi:hypothetical protein BC835DRAFT_281332 [Cytidiella melzeri]|nr:hypothetical protein BC835DRAFT_281332 [Cytidiella melzeri]